MGLMALPVTSNQKREGGRISSFIYHVKVIKLKKNLEEIQNVTAIGVKMKLKRIETRIETRNNRVETRNNWIETQNNRTKTQNNRIESQNNRIETQNNWIETRIEKENSK